MENGNGNHVTTENGSKLFVGIEGGGTSSQGVLISEHAVILATCKGGTTNQWVVGLEKACETIAEMVRELRRTAGIQDDKQITAIGLCMSGADDENRNKQWVQLLNEMFHLASTYVIENDTIGSLATARPDLAGIVLISGTGSNCILRNSDGTIVGAGGWGHMLGDEGSAYWIAQSAIKAVFDHEDRFKICPHDLTALRKQILGYFGVEKRSEILQFFYSPFEKSYIASFCSKVAEAANNGDPFSQKVFYDAGVMLARFVLAVLPDASDELRNRPGGIPVICVGSVFNSWDLLKDGFAIGLGEEITELTLYKLTGTSTIGAAILGAKKAGIDLPVNDRLQLTQRFFNIGTRIPVTYKTEIHKW